MIRAAGLVALALTAAAGAFDTSSFRYERPLKTQGPAPFTFSPDRTLYSHTRPSFADLRVLDAKGKQVPWRIGTGLVRAPESPLRRVQLLDVGREGATIVALLDLGTRRLVHNGVKLDIPAGSYVGRVDVLASDDRRSFRHISRVTVYDIHGAIHSRSTIVTFPANDQRYLELRAIGVPAITGALVSGSRSKPAAQQVWPVSSSRRIERPKRTIVRFDLGFRLPVDTLAVTSATAVYDRPITIETSIDGRHFRLAAYGRIYRYPGARPPPFEIDARARFIRLEIANGDDEPLGRIAIVARHTREYLLARGGATPPYRLLYGSLTVAAPDYDFARLPEEAFHPRRFQVATLGQESLVPRAAVHKPRSYRWLIDVALALAAITVGVVGVLALRKKSA